MNNNKEKTLLKATGGKSYLLMKSNGEKIQFPFQAHLLSEYEVKKIISILKRSKDHFYDENDILCNICSVF